MELINSNEQISNENIKDPVEGTICLKNIDEYIMLDASGESGYGIVIKPFYVYKKTNLPVTLDHVITKLIIPKHSEVYVGPRYRKYNYNCTNKQIPLASFKYR
jgi:hypothetical protein